MNSNEKCCNNEQVNIGCKEKNNFNAIILVVLYILLAIIIGSWFLY